MSPCFIGLVGLVISFQVDILLRMDRRERFVALIEGPPWVADTMARIATSLETVSSTFAGSIVDTEAQQRLTGVAVSLDELAQGRVRTVAEGRYLITETNRCTTTLFRRDQSAAPP